MRKAFESTGEEMNDQDYLRFKCDTYNATKEYPYYNTQCHKCNNRGDIAIIEKEQIAVYMCTCDNANRGDL